MEADDTNNISMQGDYYIDNNNNSNNNNNNNNLFSHDFTFMDNNHQQSSNNIKQESNEVDKGENQLTISGRLTVLVVDDSILQRNLCRSKLSGTVTEGSDKVNVFVNTAENGEKALDVCDISSKMPDVIILDQCMSSSGGKLFGHEVASCIRRKSESIIIIGCSAIGEASRQFIENGADAVWVKPIPPKQECIAQILELRKLKLMKEKVKSLPFFEKPALQNIRRNSFTTTENKFPLGVEWSHIKLNLANPIDDDEEMAFSDIEEEGMIGLDIRIQKAASISTMSEYSSAEN
jgi:CheY-like chemotaxis protein